MKIIGFILCIILPLGAQDLHPTKPDSKITPGATFPDATIEQICQTGYANVFHGGVRNVPDSEKRKVFIAYFGSVPANTAEYEIDHLVSLCLGGSNEIANLWPQSYKSALWNAHVKDRLEDYLYASVRRDLKANGHNHATALLKQYQAEISADWISCYQKHLGDPANYKPKRGQEPHRE